MIDIRLTHYSEVGNFYDEDYRGANGYNLGGYSAAGADGAGHTYPVGEDLA